MVATDAVKRAVTIARRGVGAEDITAKGGRDLVTVTDVAVEDAVRGIVAEALGTECLEPDRKSTRLNSSHTVTSYAVFCLKKKSQALRQHCAAHDRKSTRHNSSH